MRSAHGDFPCAIKDYRRLAVDLQELWERGGAKGLSGYDARLVVADAMREAFGLPPADAARVAAAPAAKLAPGAGRVARLQLKRAATARDLELIGALVLTRVDDVIACLKGGDAGGAGAAAVAAAEGGAGGAAEDDDEGGGGADEAAAAANPALARLLALLNATFGRRWPLRGDEVIQVGMTLNVYGQRECCARYVLALGGCEPVPGAHTLSFADEGQLLLAWVGLVRALDPDVVTGYNINGFDMAYLYDRAKELFGGEASPGVVERFCRLGRLEGVPSRFEEQRLASSALGDNTLRYIDMHGRVLVDLMKVVQRDHKLDSYKLDAVAQHFTGQAKHDVSPQDIFRLQRGSDADRRVIAEYCVQVGRRACRCGAPPEGERPPGAALVPQRVARGALRGAGPAPAATPGSLTCGPRARPRGLSSPLPLPLSPHAKWRACPPFRVGLRAVQPAGRQAGDHGQQRGHGQRVLGAAVVHLHARPGESPHRVASLGSGAAAAARQRSYASSTASRHTPHSNSSRVARAAAASPSRSPAPAAECCACTTRLSSRAAVSSMRRAASTR